MIINYFEFESDDNKIIKEKKKKNSFFYSKILDINNQIEKNENNSDLINKELNIKPETPTNNISIKQEANKKLSELLIETKNFYSNLDSLEDSFDNNNCKEINLINKETINIQKMYHIINTVLLRIQTLLPKME